MYRVATVFALCAAFLVPVSASPNLRVMTPAELVASSVIIARVRVVDVDESDWGDFKQVATLELEDIIEGDFTLKQIRVAARLLVAYTDDRYVKKTEMLVFLLQDVGFYRTVNYQYGQFPIENDVVKGWRNAENVASDQPYYSVREEIERLLTDMRTPTAVESPQTTTPPLASPGARAPLKPGQRIPKPPPPHVERPNRP